MSEQNKAVPPQSDLDREEQEAVDASVRANEEIDTLDKLGERQPPEEPGEEEEKES